MAREESELVRLTDDERHLVRNYRIVNEVRQDTLLYFSDELVKLERLDIQEAAKNVHVLRNHRK
jgi:hypothetical protein